MREQLTILYQHKNACTLSIPIIFLHTIWHAMKNSFFNTAQWEQNDQSNVKMMYDRHKRPYGYSHCNQSNYSYHVRGAKGPDDH